MILKYTFRLIKSTFNRFIAILAIVFIGVSFMMGLRSNYNIMQNSVEKYADDNKLYDIQIYSNFGFDKNDVKAIQNLDYVEDVYASKTRDVYTKVDNELGAVTRVLEIESNLNLIELKEGRMPTDEKECIIIPGYSSNISLGDTFSLYLEDEEIENTLKNTTFTVVGYAKSVENMTETFTVSNLNSKELNNIIYIPNSNFVSEYYTCLYISLNEARDLFSFSDEYNKLLDEKEDLLIDFSSTQSQELKNKILTEANQKLDEAKAELEENRIKYQKELNDAKAKLDKAKIELDNAKKEIEDGEIQIPLNEKKLEDAKRQLEEGKVTLAQKEAELNAAISQIESSGMSMDQLNSTVTNIYKQYTQTESEIQNLTAQREQAQANLNAYQEIINASGCSSSAECRYKKQRYNPDTEEGQAEIAKLDEAIMAFDYVKEHSNEVDSIDREISLRQVALNTIDATMQQTIGKNTVDGYQYVTSSIATIKSGQAQINQGKADLVNAQNQITNGYAELEAGKKKLENGKIEYQNGLVEYNKGVVEYEDGLKEFEHEMQEAQDQIDDAEEQLASLQEVEWTILKRYDTNYSFYLYKNTCEQMKSIGIIIPILFFIVAALVCSTTMTRLIDEQRGQIGIYRALGFTKKEITSIYMLYVIIASLAASVVAVALGVIIFPTIIYSTWRLLYDLPPIRLSMPIGNLLLCVSCFTILMMLVTFVVLNKTLKEVSSQLLRPKPPKNTKQIILEKWTWLWNKLPFTSKVTARNLLRYKVRFIMTVIGVAGCTSLLLMGFGIKDSIGGVIDLQYSEINKYNYQVNIKNDRHIDSILEDIRLDDNNEIYVPYATYQAQVLTDNSEGNITINVIDSSKCEDLFGLNYSSNNKPAQLTDDGVLLTDKYAKTKNIEVGDLISVESQTGIKKDLEVVGIIKNYVSHSIYMSTKYYKNMFGEELEYTTIGVRNDNDSSQLNKLQSRYNDVLSVTDFSSTIQNFTEMFDALNLIIIVIIIVAGALAFVVLINLTNVNISERIREIATLKVLGFRENEVDAYIFKEVLLMSLVGAIIGLPLGNIESRYVMTVIDMDMCTFPHIVQPISYVYAFVITIIFTVIVLFLTRKTLKKVEMVESLKSIE